MNLQSRDREGAVLVCALILFAATLSAQTTVEVVPVISKNLDRHAKLPGEFQPYLSVPIHAKVSGFVDKVLVDRGSVVRKGQVLLTVTAPEMTAQIAEAESKAQSVELQKTEAEAKLASATSTYEHLKAASATPGVVAQNDVVVAEKSVEAAQALVRAYDGSIQAARAAVQAIKDMEAYLTIPAPFDGVITERSVHPGALVGPNAGAGAPSLLKLEQMSRLRLIVAVPESLVGGIVARAHVPFTVPAYPGQTFSGAVSRVAHVLDEKTRTMPVELDVSNPGLRLSPGMYPEVQWPVHKARPSLLVPSTSIVTTTERTFVIRVSGNRAEWVNVTRGSQAGDAMEVYGPLQPGDRVVRRATDEIREGSELKVK
jgi:membrane fusion protein, multidrug efflux system